MRKTNKYKQSSPIKEFSINELREIGHLLNEYCKTNLGVKKSKGLPTFTVRKDKTLSCYGEFNDRVHKIYLFYNVIPNLKFFVRTFIHEYTHSLQNLRHYQSHLIRFGYTQHPDEVQARQTEMFHYREAIKYIKSKI
jgi:hypothetical protein